MSSEQLDVFSKLGFYPEMILWHNFCNWSSENSVDYLQNDIQIQGILSLVAQGFHIHVVEEDIQVKMFNGVYWQK